MRQTSTFSTLQQRKFCEHILGLNPVTMIPNMTTFVKKGTQGETYKSCSPGCIRRLHRYDFAALYVNWLHFEQNRWSWTLLRVCASLAYVNPARPSTSSSTHPSGHNDTWDDFLARPGAKRQRRTQRPLWISCRPRGGGENSLELSQKLPQ